MSVRDELYPFVIAETDEDLAEYNRRLDAYRAEVLREGADAAEQEFIYGTTPAASERDEIWDDAVRAVATMLRGLVNGDEDGEKATATTAAAATPACAACRHPFDEADTRPDRHPRHGDTEFCRSCVNRCHDSEDAFHRCPVCRAAEEKTTAPVAAAVTPQSDPGRTLAEADAGRVATTPRHIGRHWHGHDIEDNCPCPQAPCGLIAEGTAVPECTQHPAARSQTIRQSHLATACPAAEQPQSEPTPAPEPLSGWHAARVLTGRLGRLLNLIRTEGGKWRTGQVHRIYRATETAPQRATARHDLEALTALGWLERHTPPADRFYTLNSQKDSR
ncbi:hypothetical protein [Streptomyces tremellae]|uniref:RING-type domain-containing protein n=1 Tax=Streptomyces tremellae TaxID=1124239 RepID=A0ABP7EFR4_9ACTN